MINGILEMLRTASGETERIQIAQGRNKLSTSLKDALNEIKRNRDAERRNS